MQKEGSAKFLKFHQGSVRGVAFSPTDRYLFCSGAYDGRVNLYSALRAELLMCYQITTSSLSRNVSAVRFNSDGTKILATTTARRLAVIDVGRGDQLISYDNCAFNGRDRTGLAADPICPNMAVCVCVNGKGLTLFDLRMPLPLDFLYDVHGNVVRDVTFLHKSWPWVCGHQSALISASVDGVCKIVTLDGRTLHCFEAGHGVNSLSVTPETYGTAAEDGFCSLLLLGGDSISSYVPNVGVQEKLNEHREAPIWKLRYTSNGSQLYTVCDDGVVRRYRRYPDRHEFLGEVFSHRGDIQDMDISPYDELTSHMWNFRFHYYDVCTIKVEVPTNFNDVTCACNGANIKVVEIKNPKCVTSLQDIHVHVNDIITASKDRSVGILCLGAPNHGSTEYSELT